MKEITDIGVIGLGIIGKPIAERLLNAGFRVAVYDVRSEPVSTLKGAGAMACLSSAEVAAHSDLIISLVSDTAQTDEVVSGKHGILNTLKPGSIFATGSTLGPAPVRHVAASLAAKDCATIDMPITGGFLAAAEGNLALMLGGEQSTIDRATPAFRAFASTITRAGDVGAGQAAKLAHQLIMSVNIMALLEGLSLGVAGGVDAEVLRQIIKDGLANSTVLQVWGDMGPRWKGMLKPAAADAQLPNIRKDLHSALELARELGLTLPVGALTSQIADTGTAIGHTDPKI
jgi:3-hydroxyisobutyrate dehydrogenase-like beta-hydroxyacid dehydrogenase